MKKLLYSLFVFVVFIATTTPISANASVSISGPSSVSPGESFTVSLNNNNDNYSITGTMSASGSGSGSTDIALSQKGSQSLTIKAGSSGSITVKFSGQSALNGPPFTKGSTGTSKTITIVSSSGGSNSGGSSSGGSSSGGSYNPYLPKGESEAEKVARLEREAKEKAEREQKTPLIGGFEVISNDTKLNGKVLGKIETKFESFEYESMLPLFVNKVTLKATGVKEGAKVTLEANHDVNDKPISVKVQASLGDVKQEFTINLKPSDKKLFKYENEGVVYHDEAVDKVMASFGFKPEAIKIDGVDSSVYVKGSLKLQLIMNDAKQLMFYRLDEGLKVESKGYFLAAEGGSVYVTADAATSDLAKETLRGKGYQKVTLDVVPYFESIDSALVYQPTFYGWEFEEGYVVVGSDGKLENELFHVNPTHRVSAAVVAFDVQNPTLLYVSIGLGVALAAVSGAFIANYVSVDRKFKRIKNR